MDAAQRLALIRAKLKGSELQTAKPPKGLYCAANNLPPTPVKRLGRSPLEGAVSRSFGVGDRGLVHLDDAPKWVRDCDKPEVQPCRTKRIKKPSPLTKIAEAWEDTETFRPISVS